MRTSTPIGSSVIVSVPLPNCKQRVKLLILNVLVASEPTAKSFVSCSSFQMDVQAVGS